jgi:glycosyltransferase involved in cell wall biosynthesis
MALASLTSLACPAPLDYEILVIDNNSSDRTMAIIEKYAKTLGPRLRSLFEPKAGLSHARNRAIAEAQGDVICFMDDDALADPGWLAGHIAAYEQDERTVAVGGRVLLQWPARWSRPKWLGADLDGYLSGVDLGPEPRTMRYPSYPYGCNMSVRRPLAHELGGFSVSLGRKPGSLISNEEKHFFFKVDRYGGQVVYAPEAIVRHAIPRSRLSRRFFLRRAYAQGLSDAMVRRMTTEPRMLSGCRTPDFLRGTRRLMLATSRALTAHVAFKDSATRFLDIVRIAYAAGVVSGEARPQRENAEEEGHDG